MVAFTLVQRILLEEKGVRDSFSNSLFHLKQIDLYGIAIHVSLVKLFCKHELEDDPALTVADTVPACLANIRSDLPSLQLRIEKKTDVD